MSDDLRAPVRVRFAVTVPTSGTDVVVVYVRPIFRYPGPSTIGAPGDRRGSPAWLAEVRPRPFAFSGWTAVAPWPLEAAARAICEAFPNPAVLIRPLRGER